MLKERFVTKTWKGNFTILPKTLISFEQWVKFEKELDPTGRYESTTMNGWQHSFNNSESTPDWLDDLLPEINKIKDEIGFTAVKSSWAIEYNAGGYQDPHVHQPHTNLISLILNLKGVGELLLFDPRSCAVGQGISVLEIEILHPGEWIALPGWLLHGTRPCKSSRSILVIDGYSQ